MKWYCWELKTFEALNLLYNREINIAECENRLKHIQKPARPFNLWFQSKPDKIKRDYRIEQDQLIDETTVNV